jgi:hypothetical protein
MPHTCRHCETGGPACCLPACLLLLQGIKCRAMDLVLFVRHGSFYNLFDVDADGRG